jgi:tRNA A-37 threonylcarbamoyl transferase component Bud32
VADLRQQLETSLGTTYSVERELGGGGMSRVFLAEETQLGRKVVIKLLAPEFAEGLSAERFEREIRLAAGLQEPHIVPVIAAGVAAGLPFYTMPFIAGESLRARLSLGEIPLREALAILTDVATALEYAHERGIVHRDIKPENVLLSKRSAVVTDFGIAKAIADSRQRGDNFTLTAVGTSIGTPPYMAPEQIAVDPAIDQRADLYALGVLAYEIFTGATPFAGLTPTLATSDSISRRAVYSSRLMALGEIALAEGRPRDAMTLFHESDLAPDGLPATRCAVCVFPRLARAAERAAWADSARIYWERYVTTVSLDRVATDQWFLAMAYRRLGESYASAGDAEKAADYRAKLEKLWVNADAAFGKQN